MRYGSISPEGAEILKVIGRCRANVLISGGTGSGKTTLLNCLTRYIDDDERIVTCEDAAELQLQQPHVVRLETRPPNLEGEGQITMRDLVRNCLRMRPERIIVGEVRGPEAFDLLQAMNTGHDGSMGTLHANTPREGLSRLESMITMGGYSLPSRTIREMIVGSIDVVIQAARLRDGSRRITHITEVMGMEGEVIIYPGFVSLRPHRRGRQRQHRRTAQVDRHRPAEILGTCTLLRRGEAARGRARRCSGGRCDQGLRRAMNRLSRLHDGGGSDRRLGVGVHLSISSPGSGPPSNAWPISGGTSRRRSARRAPRRESRREQVEGSLKQIEARKKAATRVPL